MRQKRDSPSAPAEREISPPQSEARPAFEVDLLGEIEPLRPPGRKHARNICKKQAGDDCFAPSADDRGERRRHEPQGLRQDVGEHEVVRRALAQGARFDPARLDRPAEAADAVQPRIGVGDFDRDGSMSPSHTLRRSALAAAMASTPAPQPTSRTACGRRRLSSRSKCRRQPRVVP